ATYSATDALSGVVAPATGSFVFTTEGANQSHPFTVTDVAGNSATATVDSVNIDKTAPTASFGAASPAANAAGWNKTDVSIPFTSSDALSGIDTPTTGTFTFSSEGANQSHTFTVTDVAGNSNSATVTGINIDKTAPTLTTGRSPAANAFGWNNTDVNATYSASDALSG